MEIYFYVLSAINLLFSIWLYKNKQDKWTVYNLEQNTDALRESIKKLERNFEENRSLVYKYLDIEEYQADKVLIKK